MSDVFISYARSTEEKAEAIAEALQALGYDVWRDDKLPAHRPYTEVIDEHLQAARAVVVIWSAEAVKSDWVQSEADTARNDHKLVQLTVDGSKLPRPFDRIQCADLTTWRGEADAPGWRKVVASVAELTSTIITREPAAQPPDLAPPSKPSIAVMPFTNLSGDPDQEYFADGMVEEIVAALSRFKSLFVIASNSSLSFKGKAISPQDAGRQLGVRYLLEGSVRKAANRVRIAVKLLDATDGAQIWADRFEDTLDDVFALQDRVGLSVAGVIEPAIETAAIRRVAQHPTQNMGSYDLFLRAMPYARTREREGELKALDLLERALALDPDFGPALGMAAYLHSAVMMDKPGGDHRRQALALAHRALQAAGDDAAVLAGVSTTLWNLGQDFEAASALADRAVALNPGSASAWGTSAGFRATAGATDLAIEHIETSMRLDPLGPDRSAQLGCIGQARLAQGRFTEAAAALKEAHQLAPAWSMGNVMLIACYGHLGQPDAARPIIAAVESRFPVKSDVWATFMANYLYRMPAHQKLFLDGIALAEGGSIPDSR